MSTPPARFRDHVAAGAVAVVSRAREVVARFADLLVAAFAVAAGLAWKDTVFWLFAPGGPLGAFRFGPPALAVAITLAGAVLTTLRAYAPLTPRSSDCREQ